MIIQAVTCFTRTAAAPVSDYWYVELLGSQEPASLTNGGTPALAELMFMTSAGAGANAGTGSLITPSSSSWTNASNVFDGNASTYGFYTASGADVGRIGRHFDAAWTITHLSLTSRNDGFFTQAPKSLNLYYSLDGGTTPILYKHIPIEAAWSQGETKVIDIVAEGYASSDLSALDEVGGYRFYAIKNNGLAFNADTTSYVPELLLKHSGSKIQYKAHRQRSFGIWAAMHGTAPADGATSGYFDFPQNDYLILDFGYKRVIDEVGYTARTGFNTQAPQKLQLYGLAGAMANDASWTLAEMSLLKSIDDSGSAAPASGADRTFAYP